MGRARPSSDESSSDDESFKPRRAGVRKASRVNQQKGSSRPWSKGEEENLLKLVQAQLNPTSSYSDDQNVDWGAISARLGGRTAKQAREKFRNDLRPDISKGPWSAQEEYVLALAHSQLGNKWNAIAKYLPRRAENTIKNHWYASMRAKPNSKNFTFLAVYVGLVDAAPGAQLLSEAIQKYDMMVRDCHGALPTSASFVVPEDYFTVGQGAHEHAALQKAELQAVPLRSATARAAVAAAATAASLPPGSPPSAVPLQRAKSSYSEGGAEPAGITHQQLVRQSLLPPPLREAIYEAVPSQHHSTTAPGGMLPLDLTRQRLTARCSADSLDFALPTPASWPPQQASFAEHQQQHFLRQEMLQLHEQWLQVEQQQQQQLLRTEIWQRAQLGSQPFGLNLRPESAALADMQPARTFGHVRGELPRSWVDSPACHTGPFDSSLGVQISASIPNRSMGPAAGREALVFASSFEYDYSCQPSGIPPSTSWRGHAMAQAEAGTLSNDVPHPIPSCNPWPAAYLGDHDDDRGMTQQVLSEFAPDAAWVTSTAAGSAERQGPVLQGCDEGHRRTNSSTGCNVEEVGTDKAGSCTPYWQQHAGALKHHVDLTGAFDVSQCATLASAQVQVATLARTLPSPLCTPLGCQKQSLSSTPSSAALRGEHSARVSPDFAQVVAEFLPMSTPLTGAIPQDAAQYLMSPLSSQGLWPLALQSSH